MRYFWITLVVLALSGGASNPGGSWPCLGFCYAPAKKTEKPPTFSRPRDLRP